MAKIRYENFQNEAEDSVYPFSYASPLSLDRNFELPADVIIDAALHIPGNVGPYSLTSITTTGSTITIEVRSNDGGAASGTWSANQTNLSCVDLMTTDEQHGGVLVVSPDAMAGLLETMRVGVYIFDSSTAIFVPATYHYVPQVDESVERLSGISVSPDEDIILRGHNGVFIECLENGELQLHAVGDPRGKRAVCEDTFVPETFIREVIFQHGSDTVRCTPVDGDISLVVVSDDPENALRVKQDAGRMQFDLVGPEK